MHWAKFAGRRKPDAPMDWLCQRLLRARLQTKSWPRPLLMPTLSARLHSMRLRLLGEHLLGSHSTVRLFPQRHRLAGPCYPLHHWRSNFATRYSTPASSQVARSALYRA